jgi:hypothetical protein
MKKQISSAFLISAAAITLSGCATYTNTPQKIAYFIVPCNTPGAFAAQPVNTVDTPVIDLAQKLASASTVGSEQITKAATTCLIAASNARPWDSAYSGYGYPPYYSRPRYYGGGIGISLHGGGHRSGHHGGGHRRH